MAEVLTLRQLNRATLERQSLLRRSTIGAGSMIEHLVGLQAQNPLDPYYGLWARLDGFQATELAAMIERRRAVRTPTLRATIHLVTTTDCLRYHGTWQPVSDRTFGSTAFARGVAGIEMEDLLARGRDLIEEAPRTRAELARDLGAEWPDRQPEHLAQAVTYLLPLVQVPPRGLWGGSGQARWATFEGWLGKGGDAASRADQLVMRYLAAFGPATVSDIRAWSGLTGMAATVERIRSRLRVFRDEEGHELLDLPDAPLPDPDTPAPARFLPEYDNVLLGHADRSRVIGPDASPPGWAGNLLYDGMLRGSWKLSTSRAGARVVVSPFGKLAKGAIDEVSAEGEQLLERAHPGLPHEIQVAGSK